MPTLADFIEKSTYFPNSITPIARTFPAWNSILTGNTPKSNDIRFNLVKPTLRITENALPSDLKQHGYTTIFAQDERRFSPINEEYGFDIVIGPDEGVIDFILPIFADNPYSAYLTNSIFGKYFFPSFYSNRAISQTYDLRSFPNEILYNTANIQTPFFLATHFCLIHHPYEWRDSQFFQPLNTQHILLDSHTKAAAALDLQFSELITGLDAQGHLENALVIITSDHGEGLGRAEELWSSLPEDISHEFGGILRGHGNSLLSRDQNQIVLAIWDGNRSFRSGTNHALSSLIDIRPTILSELQPNNLKKMDGIPRQEASEQDKRILFMETGVTIAPPRSSSTITTQKLIENKIQGYELGRDGMVNMKASYQEKMLKQKQFAAISQTDILISSAKTDRFLWIDKTTNSSTLINPENTSTKERVLLDALNCYSGHAKACSPAPQPSGN